MAGGPPASDPTIVDRIGRKRERVHVLTGVVCNNNCVFCMEEDREGRAEVNGQTDDALVARILAEHPGCEEICFTSGEPTTNKRLLHWVKMAKDAGVERISVMTNGRALGYDRYAKALVAAGMRRFYVSIHGHDAKLHDGLTRTPGSFDQTVAGIRQIASFARYGVDLHTSTVITKRNLPFMGEIYAFLRGLGVDQVVFNVMQANGRADTHFEKIFPRYTEIADVARRFFVEQAAREERVMAFLVDIPLCTTEGIPDFNRGYVEAYVHYEPAGSGSHDFALPVEAEAVGEASGLVQIRRRDLDVAARDKREACRECAYEGSCEGVWRNYLRRYGWDELQPVRAAHEPAEAAAVV